LTPEEIRTLISQGEGQRLELKRSLAELETGVRAAAAMANTDGGHVLFGVRDDGAILGVQIGAQTRERVVQAITDNTDPTLYPSVEYVDLNGKTVIVVTVSRSEDRPHLVRGRAAPPAPPKLGGTGGCCRCADEPVGVRAAAA